MSKFGDLVAGCRRVIGLLVAVESSREDVDKKVSSEQCCTHEEVKAESFREEYKKAVVDKMSTLDQLQYQQSF
jgi:hypothetical protein